MNQLAPSPTAAFHQPGGHPFAYNAPPPPPPPQTSPPPPQQQQQQGNFGLGPYAGQSLGYASSDGARGASSSAMLPPPAGTPQGQRQPSFNYTSAPAQQPLPAQFPPQQPTRPIRPSASPPVQQHPQQQHPSPPNAAPQHPTPPHVTTKYPMAAPPLPNTPSSTTGAPMTSASPPKTPLSPNSENREAQRIAHLLHLNSALLSEISTLQASGQGGVLNPAQAEQARQKGLPDKMASEDYIHTMRRVQANLQYLMSKNQPAGSEGGKKIEGPAIMTAPPHLGERLRGEYERLKELFPEWNGIEGKSAGGGTPGRQGSGVQQQGQQAQMPQQMQQQQQ